MSGHQHLAATFCSCIVTICSTSGAEAMPEIQFDIGKDIAETARASGVKRYSVQDVDGLLMYDATGLNKDGSARYVRPGYEISFSPVFSVTLYADKKSSRGLSVQTAALQVSTRTIKSHASARAFVESVILQFQKGHWERHIDSLCPAVTGKSSFLNESGQISPVDACALDPNYRLSDDEWKQLMVTPQSYEWIGAGVLAQLKVSYNEFGRGLVYAIDLDFDDFEQKKKRDENESYRHLAEGDAKGWKSTEKHIEYIAAARKRLILLEQNAVKRGDKVIQRR